MKWNEMIVRSFKGISPVIDPTAWIAENAVIIGDVMIGPNTNIWYNVIIRGDLNKIRIGSEVNIQDGAILHVESDNGPCIIGNRVTIGHQAIVHGCRVDDDSLIGMGSTILSWAHIGPGAVVAAGALIRENSIIPERTLWAGIPAQERGTVNDDMFSRMQDGYKHYLNLAEQYRRENDTLSGD